MDPECKLRGDKSSLIKVEVLIKDSHDSDAFDFSITELPNIVIGEVPKEDIVALILVIWFRQMNILSKLDIDVILWYQHLDVLCSDLCLLGLALWVVVKLHLLGLHSYLQFFLDSHCHFCHK